MEGLEKDFEANKGEVIDLLLKNVTQVNIEIPKVVKGVFE